MPPLISQLILRASRLALIVALGLAGCAKNEPVAVDSRAGSVELWLGSPVVTTLGPLEGPYQLDRVETPRFIHLFDAAMKSTPFDVLGLRDDEYPMTNEQIKELGLGAEGLQQRRLDLRLYMVEQIQALLDKKELWVLRMAETQPPQVYLFHPRDKTAAGAIPTGAAKLVNAWVLREGIAVMELAGAIHPFYEKMLDAQLAAIGEARRYVADPAAARDVWNRFRLNGPGPQFDARIELLAKPL